MPLATIPEAITAFKAGRFVIIVDDEDRENEGDLVIPAQMATPGACVILAHRPIGASELSSPTC